MAKNRKHNRPDTPLANTPEPTYSTVRSAEKEAEKSIKSAKEKIESEAMNRAMRSAMDALRKNSQI